MNDKLTPRPFQSKGKTLHNPPVYHPGKTDAAQRTARPAPAAPPVYNPRDAAATPPAHGSITPPVFGLSRIKTVQPAQALVKGSVCRPAVPVPLQPKIVSTPTPNPSVLLRVLQMNQLLKRSLPAVSTNGAIQLMTRKQRQKIEEKWQKVASRAKEYGASQETHNWLRIAKALGMAPPDPEVIFGHGSGNKNSGGSKKAAQQALSNWIALVKAEAVQQLRLDDDPKQGKIMAELKME